MKQTTALKTLLRSPLKALLTFLLIAAASFALFSRITDYAITTRESAKAESFYSGVAALDTSVPDIGYYTPEPKPWPSDEQIQEFSSLPGVSLADTRYATEGLIEDYKRVIDQETPIEEGEFVLEGTFDEIKKYDSNNQYLIFHDITVYAGELVFNPDKPIQVRISPDIDFGTTHKHPQEFFESLEKGCRCLVFGTYSERSGTAFFLGSYMNSDVDALRVIDGLGEDYLETEDFAWYREKIEARNIATAVYDIIYTADMRAIPYVNERRIIIAEGRPLTAGDTNACVVSKYFLETYGLSVGDRLHIKLGDRLQNRMGTGGTRYYTAENIPHFNQEAVELEIIGTYAFTDEGFERSQDFFWSYGPASVFVPSSLLPVEVPEDYEIQKGDFSVFIEDPHDIEAFRTAAEPLVADMGLALRFSDGGWVGMKDNFETSSLASFLTTMLYVIGAALALLLAAYLYIGRNKKPYAIMRTLGVPGRKAGASTTLPFLLLSLFAIPAGGITGLFYASHTAAKALASLSDTSAPEGYVYVLDSAIPAGVVALCLVFEMVFILLIALLFLHKMERTSPLDLLQEETGSIGIKRTGILQESFAAAQEDPDAAPAAPARLDLAKITAALETDGFPQGNTNAGRKEASPQGNVNTGWKEDASRDQPTLQKKSAHRKYRPLQQMFSYILCHMRRSIRKTTVSLALTLVLSAGIGMFVLAKLSYQEAYRDMEVNGRAMAFSSSGILELAKSDLIKDIYYYNNYSVRVNGVGVLSPMLFTNDFDRYLTDDFKITYAEGYDSSVFEGTGPVCLIGTALAEEIGAGPGDKITLMSEDLYSFMPEIYAEDELAFAIERAGKPYTVVGILESENTEVNSGIFASINEAAENLYSQPFGVDYCEFTLADNTKLMDLNNLLEEKKNKSIQFSPMASFHINSDLLQHTKRIRNLLVSLFPIAVAAAVLIGMAGSGLVIIQSTREAAFLRILGVTKPRTRCMLALEQVLLCLLGIALVAGGIALFDSGHFIRSAQTLTRCWTLYLLGCILGAAAAAIIATRHKVLELLQVKE